MPWTVRDVEGFNAGLTAAKKRQWVAVANSALSACLERIDGTPTDEQRSRCEGSAVRQANGVVKEEADVEDDEKATWTAAQINDFPDSSFALVESGGSKDDQGKTVPRSLRHLPYKDGDGTVDLPHLRNAIARAPQIKLQGGKSISSEQAARIQSKLRTILAEHQKSLLWRLADHAAKIKAWFGVDGGEDEELESEPEYPEQKENTNAFMVWKQAGGDYRWLAVYSNKFRDEDDPPEILSEAAHKEFVAAVDKGEWPMPEFWLWHTKGTSSGRADFVAYDDLGFALASGLVDDVQVGERLAQRSDLAVSHGMPVKELRRDGEDPTIITRYRTSEISALPRMAAANKLTGFYMKEQDMAIDSTKRQFLADILGEDRVKQLENELDSKAKDAEGLEFKETPAPEPEQKEGEAVEAVETPPEPTPQYVTAQEVSEAVGAHLSQVLDRLDALSARLDEMSTKMAGLEKTDEQRVAEIVTLSPAASLRDMIGSVIGRQETLVDGRTKEARDKPAETPAPGEGPFPVGIMNQMFKASWGGK